MSVRVRAGTSGFSYAGWKGTFYPAKLAAGEMLGHYAGRLPTVELNNTFYRMPKEAQLGAWAAQVPADFTFALKAPRRITHTKRLNDAGDPVAFFLRQTACLGPRRGPLLFQLPPTLRRDVPRLRGFLDELAAQVAVTTPAAPPHVAIEFRHASWFDDEVCALLRDRGAALCVADTGEEPAAPLVATADWGYLRLRREDFAEGHLREWARRILGQPWREAFVYLKHEEDGLGPRLAVRLMELCAHAGA